MPPTTDQLAAAIRKQGGQNAQLQQAVQQLQGFMQGIASTPKWIEDIPGKRQPHFEVIELVFPANSTAERSGVSTVSVDGPFICTAVALFWKKTSGAYTGVWGPATAFGARIAPIGQEQGFERIFDQPHCASFTIEIVAHGNQNLWQNQPISSALWSPEAGGVYVLPSSHLFPRASSIQLKATPDVEMTYSGLLQGIFLGYRILQGYQYQP